MVELVSKTQPFANCNLEEWVVKIARISSDRVDKFEDYEKLISYLIRNEHWSPFEHVSFTFKIRTTRAISAQLIRHRSFVFQEFSQRYSDDIRLASLQLRKKAKKNRQGSAEMLDYYKNNYLYTEVENQLRESLKLYKKLVNEHDIAPECARMVLPMSTVTELYMTGSIRSWLHFLLIRLLPNTQQETRLIAEEIRNWLIAEIPLIIKYLDISLKEKIDNYNKVN